MTGDVRLRFEPGSCTVVGRRSDAFPLRPVTRDLRQRRRVRPVRRRGIRAPVRAAAEGVGGDAGARRVSDGGSTPLWAGRFSTPPAPEAHALGPLAPLRRAPGLGQDVRRVDRARPRAARRRSARRRRGGRAGGGARGGRGGHRARDGSSFHDADEDIHSAIERAVTERLGDLGREAARRPVPQRPRRDRPAAVAARGRPCGSTRSVVALVGGARRARPRARGDRHAGHDPRALRAAGHARSPPARARVGARPRPRAPRGVVGPHLDVAARRRRDRDLDARARSRRDRGPARHAPGVRELDRRGERPRLRAGVPRRSRRSAPRTCRDSRPISTRWTDRVARVGGRSTRRTPPGRA